MHLASIISRFIPSRPLKYSIIFIGSYAPFVCRYNQIFFPRAITLCDNPIISPIQSEIKVKQVTICSHNIYVFLLIISRVKMSTPK